MEKMETINPPLVPVRQREMCWVADGILAPLLWLNAAGLPALADLARVVTEEGDRGFAEGRTAWERNERFAVLHISITAPVAVRFDIPLAVDDFEVLQLLKPARMMFTTMPPGVSLNRSDWVTLDLTYQQEKNDGDNVGEGI